ncbi:DUF1178 family protein [Ottowia thiooxydans]|uniref:DUF1178 family protein n=1 Tax=Ottowia thiooxydans TaxID=219182 RepID=UPI00041AC19C|nr:DUF1178 family protein [Ottowia thiooxydans]
MKVFDLQCAHGHVFEGWFGSEDDFQHQLSSHLLACPMCNETAVTKLPSAPRLNFGAVGADSPRPEGPKIAPDAGGAEPVASLPPAALQAAWMQMVRRVVANTEDVGERFAEEARRIHYGEADERGIRGQASQEETAALLDEGIAVVPLPVPPGFKETLQ